MNIDENIFRMHIYPMLNHLNIDELNISFIPQYMDWGIGGLGEWGIGGLGDWGIYPTTARWRSSH